jgi:hypothetical protein
MRPKRLTPQPFTMEGFLAWAKEVGHYPAIICFNNFKAFTKEHGIITKPPQDITSKK